MRMPWVSRAALDATREALRLQEAATVHCRRDAEREREKLEAEIARLRAKLDERDAVILSMRREGFDPQDIPRGALEAVEDGVPDNVLAAIERVTVPGSRVHYSLLRDAKRDLGEGRDAKEVAAELERGSELNPHFI